MFIKAWLASDSLEVMSECLLKEHIDINMLKFFLKAKFKYYLYEIGIWKTALMREMLVLRTKTMMKRKKRKRVFDLVC